ncbi:hypothetical protein [Halomonas saccharevitans]|uniref:Uncharacterized protein n=1 Tax=Halomonas saccharevitans TaxID=416872 RepID=A0A1I7AFG9_9GAMM|nr:hypothetical protein [Halomonas saccharevitans]SFT73654.1 hypothetical protein SAMN04487956_11738 [Halomonas saccharevitans]
MEKVGAFTERTTSEGEWRQGEPASNVRATPMLAAYFNMLQRELVAVLADAGLTPDINDEAQLAAAINAIADRRAVSRVDGVAVITVEEA